MHEQTRNALAALSAELKERAKPQATIAGELDLILAQDAELDAAAATVEPEHAAANPAPEPEPAADPEPSE